MYSCLLCILLNFSNSVLVAREAPARSAPATQAASWDDHTELVGRSTCMLHLSCCKFPLRKGHLLWLSNWEMQRSKARLDPGALEPALFFQWTKCIPLFPLLSSSYTMRKLCGKFLTFLLLTASIWVCWVAKSLSDLFLQTEIC